MSVPLQSSTLPSRSVVVLALSCAFAAASAFGAGCSETDSGSPIEAGADAPLELDASAADAGLDSGICEPMDVPASAVSALTADAAASAAFHQNVCAPGLVSRLIDCAFDPAINPPNCQNILGVPTPDGGPSGEEICRDCLMTPRTAPVRGPILLDQGFAHLNVAGCIATALNDASDRCAPAYAAFEDCVALACERCLPRGVPAYEACATAARRGTCEASLHADDRQCIRDHLSPGGVAAVCNAPAHFLTGAIAYGTLFCGPPPPDAGPDDADAAGN